MAEVRIVAESREATGTSGARAVRREGRVPGVLYGHGRDVLSVSLDARELRLALRQQGALFSVALEDEEVLALPKELQRHPLRNELLHIDLQVVSRGEKVTVDVPIHLVGETVSGGILTQLMTTVSIEVAATDIPSSLDVDVEGLDIGGQRTASDVPIPEAAVLLTPGQDVVASVLAPAAEVEEVAEVEGEEVETEAAEETEGE